MADVFCKVFNACFVEEAFPSHARTENAVISRVVYCKPVGDRGRTGKDLLSKLFIDGIQLVTLCIELTL